MAQLLEVRPQKKKSGLGSEEKERKTEAFQSAKTSTGTSKKSKKIPTTKNR